MKNVYKFGLRTPREHFADRRSMERRTTDLYGMYENRLWATSS